MLSFISHNIAKQPPTSHILRRLKQGYDVMFFQEVLKKPLVPHSFASGNDRAVIVSNVSSKREHGTCLVFSPRLRPFVEPIARVDKEGLIAAALLHLPGAPPILVASVSSPYKASRLDMERLRNTIRQSLQPLLVKYPNHVLGGDFNTMVTPSLDGHNMCSGRPWDWLASKVTSSPPRLVDSFRSFHPTRRVYTRYPQPHHSSESRIDMIFYSPPASQHLTPQSADILTNDKSSNHHPTTFYASAPPLPFREQPILKRKMCEWSPSLLPPPPLGTISDGLLPIAHKITPSHLRRLYPPHANYNIHTATSFDYYAHSRWFSIRPFKWTSGNLNVTTRPLHDDLRVYPCHLCGTPHVMEPLAHLALCPSADPILQSLIHTWPHLFDAITQQWWATPPPVGDKRNFVRTLVPTSLHQAFLVPTSGQTNAERRRQLQEALPVRRRALHSAIPKAVEWLREHSPQLPRPARSPPTHGAQWAVPSARLTPPRPLTIIGIRRRRPSL